MDLKVKALAFDHVLGHNREPPRKCEERREECERKMRRALTEAFFSAFSPHTSLTPYFDPK
jgi:hypothetical protein